MLLTALGYLSSLLLIDMSSKQYLEHPSSIYELKVEGLAYI